MTDKATRATVTIGSLEVDGFMLADSSYRMSQSQAAQAIDEPAVYALRFLQSRDANLLLGESYTDYTPESVEIESEPGKRGQSRINALPLEVVSAYWLYKAFKGNRTALLLCWALITESLERRFDRAFQVTRSEDDYDSRLESRRLGEIAQGLYDELLQADDWFLRTNTRIRQLERLLLQHGINPMTADEDEGDDRYE